MPLLFLDGADSDMKHTSRESGFTLVELLVVITIIGILIALLLPAVQAAREAARRTQCCNKIKQLALGAIGHESANGYFPTGGWGPCWAGVPDGGFGRRQPGGWIYSILPYIEQQPLHDLGMGADNTTTPKLSDCVLQQVGTPLTGLICPSRRDAVVYPHGSPGGQQYHYRLGDVSWPPLAGKTDYAANGGTTGDGNGFYGPTSYAAADAFTGADWSGSTNKINHVKDTGVVFAHSATTAADITDGTSNTYLIGEKYCDPDHYTDGTPGWDDQSWDIGQDWDTIRWTGCLTAPGSSNFVDNNKYLFPQQDTPGDESYGMAFGSAHSGGFYMGFCDGSVQFMNYSIDTGVHWYLGNRADDHPIDPRKL